MTVMRWSRNLNLKPKVLILQHGGNYSIGNEYTLRMTMKFQTNIIPGAISLKKHFPSYSHQIYQIILYKKQKNKFKKKYFTLF